MTMATLVIWNQILSSLAVLGTQIYPAIQTRQTNTTLLVNSRQATMTAETGLVAAMINSPGVNANAQKRLSKLSFAEQEQVGNLNYLL